MVEVELSVLADQCRDRRLPGFDAVRAEVAAWAADRNAAGATVRWRVPTAHAPDELHRLYPHKSAR